MGSDEDCGITGGIGKNEKLGLGPKGAEGFNLEKEKAWGLTDSRFNKGVMTIV